MINSSLIGLETARMRDDVEWLFVPVTDVGKQVGHLMVATMVMIAAFAAETNLVDVAGIRSSLTEVIPAYRHKLLEMDDLGLARGTEIIAATPVLGRDPGAAWPQESEWRQKAFRFNSSTDYLFRRSSNPIPV
jgi:hypothetical protein